MSEKLSKCLPSLNYSVVASANTDITLSGLHHRMFEAQIQNYSGDDPLDPWDRFVFSLTIFCSPNA